MPVRAVKGTVSHSWAKNLQLGALIDCLLFNCGPLAILRLIVSLVVYSIKRVTLAWPLPHVREKVCKAIFPSRTDSDSATAVASIIGKPRVGASGFHVLPGLVFWSPRVVFCMSMCHRPFWIPRRQLLTLKATATVSRTTSQIMGQHVYGLAAIADATPASVAVGARLSRRAIRRAAYHDQAPEPLLGQIIQCRAAVITALKTAKWMWRRASAIGDECVLAI